MELRLNIKERMKWRKSTEGIILEAHRNQLTADVRKLVEKYRAIFDWDVPDTDQNAAEKLILVEMRKALEDIEKKLLG